MPLSLTVVTHSNVNYQRDTSRCIASVRAALTGACKHVVIPLVTDNNGFMQARYDALKLGDVIAFVDDDDTITPDALALCLDALNKYPVGVAFTDCTIVCADGQERRAAPCQGYGDIASRPSALHHLVAIRTSAVTPRALALAQQYGCGIEWIMKAEAALTQGAVHIPKVGYHYVRNLPTPQRSRSDAISQAYRAGIGPIGEVLKGWTVVTGGILEYVG